MTSLLGTSDKGSDATSSAVVEDTEDSWTECLPLPDEALLRAEDVWADCLSLDADIADLDEGLDGDFNHIINQETSTATRTEDLLEETMKFFTARTELSRSGSETLTPLSSMPIPTEVSRLTPLASTLVVPSVPISGPISPRDEGTDHAAAPAFTRQDEIAELASLTDTEIQGIFSDLHGITSAFGDLGLDDSKARQPPNSLSRLEDELSKLPAERKDAYCQAVLKCPGLVSDKRKMAFLEREDGDPALAAVRLALYWELRLEVFGLERCFLPMTLNGAMKGEAENIAQWPVHQLLSVRDTAGRAIWYADASLRDFDKYSINQELMALWYLFEVAMEDPQVLQRGIVFLGNAQNVEMKHFRRTGKQFNPPAAKKMTLITERAMPIHLRAIHVCHPSTTIYYVLPFFIYIYGRHYRQRFQLHRGSEAKVLQDLEAFCLPKNLLPTDLGGEVVLDMALFLAQRLTLESSRPDPRLVLDKTAIGIPNGPATKRIRNQNKSSHEENEAPSTCHQNAAIDVPKKNVGGRPSDPRMATAVDAKLEDPDLSLLDALEIGGFTFNSTNSEGYVVDADNVTMVQRKNQLCRRLRYKKSKFKPQQEQPEHTASSSATSALSPSAKTTGVAPLLERRDSFDDTISEVLGFDESGPAP